MASTARPHEQAKRFRSFITTKTQQRDLKEALKHFNNSENTKINNMKKWVKRIFIGKNLDAQQQQERTLDLEHQQEKEQEAQNMGSLEHIQERAWAHKRTDICKYLINELFGDMFERNVVHVSNIELPGAPPLHTDLELYFTINHTLVSPPNNSRLKNIEVVLRLQLGPFVVVSLAEASTIRWVLSRTKLLEPIQFIFLETYQGDEVEVLGVLELLEFFNVSLNHKPLYLESILANVSKPDRLNFFTVSNTMRRRAWIIETSHDSPIKQFIEQK